jgi:hypothetical protein
MTIYVLQDICNGTTLRAILSGMSHDGHQYVRSSINLVPEDANFYRVSWIFIFYFGTTHIPIFLFSFLSKFIDCAITIEYFTVFTYEYCMYEHVECIAESSQKSSLHLLHKQE